MNESTFLSLASELLSSAEFNSEPDPYTQPEDFGDGWLRQTFTFPDRLEVLINYLPPYDKPYSVWFYKYPYQDWEHKPVSRDY